MRVFSVVGVYQMEKIKTKTLSDFKIIEYELGRGTMGRVLLGQWLKEPKTYIAVKEINIKTLEDNKEKQIGNEIMNMLKLESSPYIVQLYSYARTENHLYLFLEFCEDGDLKSYIEKRNGKLSESEALTFFRHIVQGYKKLFQNNIIHRDIKPANILLKQGIAKITDFGFSRVVDKIDESAYFTYLGSPLYTAPEILKIQKFGAKCDVWSVGVVLYEMLYGKTPWNGSNLEDLTKNILTTELQFKLPQRSERVKELLRGMLTIDPKNRISWPDIFKHPICQQQITSVKSVKANYTDIIPMFIDYLKQNVARGYLMLNTQGVEASKSLGTDFQVDQIAHYRERMLNIFVKILYDRNVAFFYNYILGLLYRFPDRLPKKVNANSELEYVIAKIGLECIESIIRRYLVKDPTHIPPEDWVQFKTTSEFRNINQLLSEDFNILRQLFMAIKQKVKQNYIDNKGGERIAKHLDMDGDYWKTIMVTVLDENLKALNKEKNPDNLALLLRDYLSKALNPKQHFVSEAFDFHYFYENNEVKYGII